MVTPISYSFEPVIAASKQLPCEVRPEGPVVYAVLGVWKWFPPGTATGAGTRPAPLLCVISRRRLIQPGAFCIKPSYIVNIIYKTRKKAPPSPAKPFLILSLLCGFFVPAYSSKGNL